MMNLQYEFEDLTDHSKQYANACFWAGEKDGVLYRKQFFDFDLTREMHWIQQIDFADFGMSRGILRADRLRLHRRPVRITLGSFGFPDNGTEETVIERGNFKAVVLKGHDSQGREKRMAMTIFAGWDSICTVKSEGTNPDSKSSTVIKATATKQRQYGGEEEMFLISQVITGEDHGDFSEEELFPVRKISYRDEARTGTVIELADGTVRTIDFTGLEGGSMI